MDKRPTTILVNFRAQPELIEAIDDFVHANGDGDNRSHFIRAAISDRLRMLTTDIATRQQRAAQR
jgi:hypothetical protein